MFDSALVKAAATIARPPRALQIQGSNYEKIVKRPRRFDENCDSSRFAEKSLHATLACQHSSLLLKIASTRLPRAPFSSNLETPAMRKMLLAVALAFLFTPPLAAQSPYPTTAVPAQTANTPANPYSALPINPAATSQMTQVAYPAPAQELPAPAQSQSLDMLAPPSSTTTNPVYIPQQSPQILNIPPAHESSPVWHPTIIPPAVDPPCPPDSVYRTPAWQLSIDLIPTSSHLTRGRYGEWPDDSAPALRLALGYENENGNGIRGRWWIFGQDVNVPGPNIDLAASILSLDFSKRLFLDETELVIGAGPAAGALIFEIDANDESHFSGGGLSVFAELWHPLWRLRMTDVGTIVRGRYSLLVGEWEDTTGFVIPDTDHDNMNVAELAWGFDLRRRFGPRQDKYWYIATLIEHHHWQSAMMNEFMDSSLGFTGSSISLGMAY